MLEIPEDVESMIEEFCCECTAVPDGICPGMSCDFTDKMRRMPWEKVRAAYERHGGDIVKVSRYVSQYKGN